MKLKMEIYTLDVHLFDGVFLHVGSLLDWQGAVVVQFCCDGPAGFRQRPDFCGHNLQRDLISLVMNSHCELQGRQHSL